MKVSEAELLASVCRESFQDFVREFWHVIVPEPLVWNWHMTLMCQAIQTVYERIFRWEQKEYDLLINVPPGSSKSTICSVMAPAWAWTRMPSFRFIGASHSFRLAMNLARLTRDVVKSELYHDCFPEISIRADQDAKDHFINTKGGVRYAVGSGGVVIGMHGHVVGVDDPIDPERTASEAELFAVNEWIRNTLSQRKVDNRISVLQMIMQRLHQDDPAAQMMERGRVLKYVIPASTAFEIFPPELAANYRDGLMDPVRFSEDVLEEKRGILGEYGYAAQYGQDPVPAGGGTFKTQLLRWGTPPGRYRTAARFWDKAVKAGFMSRRAAYTVGVLMAEDYDGRYWVLDVIRVRLDSFSREKLIRVTAHRDGRGVIVGQEQEPGSGGEHSAVMTAKGLAGFRVKTLRATGSKEVRAETFSVQVNAGNVFLPERCRQGNSWVGWAKDYVDELRHWPVSKFKDQGDASGGAFTVLSRGQIRIGPLRKKKLQAREEG